ncbi:helix-turn-helix domain-containing protein [Mycolicibacterium hippocampi]|uniref:AraC family transcriptional regulator n=1 Tax=Mycolicibacterium hippocampi TaxID=659824 RepID=UPI003513A2E3
MHEMPEPPAGRCLINADDLDQAEAQIAAAFGAIRIEKAASSGITRTRVWRSDVGALSIDDSEYSYDMSYEMAAPEKILLCRVHSGVLEETPPGGPARSHGTGAVVAFGTAAGRPLVGRCRHARYHMVNVPRRALAEAAGGDPDGAPVWLTDSAPVSAAANRHLVDVIDHIRHGLLGNPFAAQEPLISSGVTRYLAASMLAAFPHTAADPPGPVTDNDNHDALRRATAFIDDNVDNDISPADIADAARVTTPALESLFARHRECSSTQYLQQVRLTYVHRDLAAADPATNTVAGIARRWGFWNLVRFRTNYYKTYGRAPENTLDQ